MDKILLKIKDLSVSYEDREVINKLSLTLYEGEKLAIMGESGCGKTTLMHAISGLIEKKSGTVELSAPISIVFQEDRLCEDFSLISNIKLTAKKGTKEEDILSLIKELKLEGKEREKIRELSGGMKRRGAIARAILAPHSLLLLDEPFEGLDADTKEAVIAAIKKREGSLILVTHSKEEAEMLCDRVVFM